STADNVSNTGRRLQFDRSGQGAEMLAIRRGCRGSTEIVEMDMPLNDYTNPAVVLHYQDPENFMAVCFTQPVYGGCGTDLAALIKRQNGVYSTLATSSIFTMSSGDRVKCVISGGD